MGWRIFLSFTLTLIVIALLLVYLLIPFGTIDFYITDFSNKDFNFTINGSQNSEMQFYQNMRYSYSEISYNILDCPLYKENDMKDAFNVIENLTILKFNPTNSGEEISVTCEERTRSGKVGLFIAGEGGPSNITRTDNFNVILNGEILLIRESKCKNPNIGIHELLHALGFNHSINPGSIMYSVSKCNQKIGDDLIRTIDELYSVQSLADLSFENVSAVMNGKYLNTNISIRNNGLIKSGDVKIIISVDNKEIKEIELGSLGIGFGTTITSKNIFISQLTVSELTFEIKSDFDELSKENNKIKLELKS